MATLKVSTSLAISWIILVCVSNYGSVRASISSFETNYGIFDCVDIYKQPAFDNPLLKHHKLQRWPSRLPVIQEERPLKQGWLLHPINGSGIKCPEGTVPIKRATKEDIIRPNTSIGLQDYDPFTSKDPNTYYAVLKLKKIDKPYLLVQAQISIHRPNAQNGASGAQIWMYGGDGRTSNYISVGWMVDRDLYGDDATHFTLTWKGDDNTGCANTQCPGYVQTNSEAPPGFVFNYSSSPGHLIITTAYIFKDLDSQNWWLALNRGDEHLVPIGYWPKELFSGLKDGASYAAFGGVARAKPQAISPPMGSGTADCNFQNTAYIGDVKYAVDAELTLQPDWSQTENHVDCPDGYSLQHDCGESQAGDFAFMYGGKGGCSN